jgi:hypothetical protein
MTSLDQVTTKLCIWQNYEYYITIKLLPKYGEMYASNI